MPNEKFLVVANCRVSGKHVAKGTVIELDSEDARQKQILAELHRAGRIGFWSLKNEKFLQEEVRREESERERRTAESARAGDSTLEMAKRLAKILQPA